MSEHRYTVISTAITQEIPEDFTVEQIRGPIQYRTARVRTTLRLEIYVDDGGAGEVLIYEAEIPPMMISRRPVTEAEMMLAYELREVERRYERRSLGMSE